MLLTSAEILAIRRQAEAEYPRECCGVVLVRTGGSSERQLFPCRNVQDRLHAQDPARHPRDARTAYYIAPQDLLAIGQRETDGFELSVIYHSHIDVGAYFSATDRQNALVDGLPAYPTATYVVVAVGEGVAGEARAFRWDQAVGDFVEVELSVS